MRLLTVPVAALAGTLVAMGAFAQGAQPQGNQPQGGMMMGCPMMQRMAAMDARLRQLEERAGIPTPPAQPGAPGTVC